MQGEETDFESLLEQKEEEEDVKHQKVFLFKVRQIVRLPSLL